MISLDYTVVYQMILFLILWVVLARILFRPYLSLLEERERRSAGTQHESVDLAHEGERLKAQYEAMIAEAQSAGLVAKEAILREAREQREKMINHAREEAARTLEQVRREIQRQVEREKQFAMAEVSAIAQAMVVKVLGRRVG